MRILVLGGLLIAGLALPAATAGATGMMTCEPVPQAEWMSKDALTSKLTEQGGSVRFMKEDGGCWEVYATDPDGRRVEAYFHPSTGEKLLVCRRGGSCQKFTPE